jgi:hypothetical protein
MSNPYDTSDPRCNAWYKGYDVAMKKVENQFGEKVDLKKENAELKEKEDWLKEQCFILLHARPTMVERDSNGEIDQVYKHRIFEALDYGFRTKNIMDEMESNGGDEG